MEKNFGRKRAFSWVHRKTSAQFSSHMCCSSSSFGMLDSKQWKIIHIEKEKQKKKIYIDRDERQQKEHFETKREKEYEEANSYISLVRLCDSRAAVVIIAASTERTQQQRRKIVLYDDEYDQRWNEKRNSYENCFQPISTDFNGDAIENVH